MYVCMSVIVYVCVMFINSNSPDLWFLISLSLDTSFYVKKSHIKLGMSVLKK